MVEALVPTFLLFQILTSRQVFYEADLYATPTYMLMLFWPQMFGKKLLVACYSH